jgi:hypothetical protein
MTTMLTIMHGATTYIELAPGDVQYLDRVFLAGDINQNALPRQENSPRLFHSADGWVVYNQSDRHELVLETDEPRRHVIGPRSMRVLDVGDCDLTIGQVTVALTVAGPRPVHITVPGPKSGPITLPVLDDEAESRILELFKKSASHRIITYVRFQEYFAKPQPGAFRPQPLQAKSVLLCYPEAELQTRVNQVQRDIANIAHLNLNDTGPWLVQRGILHSGLRQFVPHVECEHQR